MGKGSALRETLLWMEVNVKRLKIAFHLNCLDQGGAERVVSTLANRFVEEYEVILATEWVAENEYEIDSRIRRVHVGLIQKQEKKNRIGEIIARNLNLRKFIKAEKPDILIAFAKKANYRALFASIGTGIPVIVSVRTDPNRNYTNLVDKIMIPLLYPKAVGNVFQTVGARDFFAPRIQRKSRIILNPINPKYLNAAKPEKRIKEVVQAGRIVDSKNQYMLIEAFALVHEKHPDYVLKIYGTDSGDGTWKALEECIAKHHAKEYVFLMGGSTQLDKDLPKAAVFALSSNWEGLPNALLEAMAMGLPVVATDCPCGGPATLITHEKNGLLVPVGDKQAMADGINRLIENPDYAEQLGEEARKIAEIASIEKIYKQWEEYILLILRNLKKLT